MRFVEFKLLPLPMKARLICESGSYLTERTEGDYVIVLYALTDFYAEVHHRADDSEVVMIGSFYNTALLEPYLAQMNLNGLLRAVLYRSESKANDATL